MAELASEQFDYALDKGTVDALVCGDDYDKDIPAMIREVFRLLKPGGLYMYDDCEAWTFSRYLTPRGLQGGFVWGAGTSAAFLCGHCRPMRSQGRAVDQSKQTRRPANLSRLFIQKTAAQVTVCVKLSDNSAPLTYGRLSADFHATN